MSRPTGVAVTGSAGVLGSRLMRLLAGRDVRGIDRQDGHELVDLRSYSELLVGCDAVVHTAALHPLVAPPHATATTYEAANVAPLVTLVQEMLRLRVRRLVLISSTSVWMDSEKGQPARFVDESTPADAEDGYATSKRDGERLAARSGLELVTLRLARFAARGDPEDDVRLLYRAIDPADAAAAVVSALDRAPTGSLYAISATTPFLPEDAERLDRDPREVIRLRCGRSPDWVPRRIGSVIVASRARRELRWRPEHVSSFLPRDSRDQDVTTSS